MVTNLVTISLLTTAAAVTLWLVGGRAVEALLGGEAFDAEDVATTTMLLGAFALSVPLEAVIQLLSRAIYSTHDTILPVLASVTGLVVTVGTVELLADPRGIVALPLGFAAGLAAKVTLLLVAVRRRVSTVGRPGRGASMNPAHVDRPFPTAWAVRALGTALRFVESPGLAADWRPA